MRRAVGSILIGVGAFFLTLAPLIKFYVADRVIVAPADFWQKTTLKANGAVWFDSSKLKKRTNITLVATHTLRGDPLASRGGVVVWDSFTSIKDPDSDADVEVRKERYALDSRSGELRNCCGAAVDQDTSVKQSGLGFIWPLGNVEKRTYYYFDPSTKQAWPIGFDGTDKIQGITAYRFVQNIPDTRIETRNNIPADWLGLDKKLGNVTTDRFYSAVVTIWVDPRTGIPVSQQENVRSTLRSKDGAGKMTVVAADLKTTPDSQKSLVQLSNGYAWKFAAVKEWGPVGSLILGLFMLATGALLPFFESGGSRDKRSRPRPRDDSARPSERRPAAPDRPGSERYSSRR